jgi:hypothetical protein
VDLNGIWRFDLVRGFSGDPSQGACLLTAVSWLVDGKLTDRPKCVCPLLAQFGRHANDILYQRDRQRLRAFIYRMAGSRDSSAIKRRAHIIVDGIMSGILNECPALGLDRLVAYLALARTICSLRFGWYRAAADTALFGFARLYERPGRDRRAQLVNVLCMTIDEALSAGREGQPWTRCGGAGRNQKGSFGMRCCKERTINRAGRTAHESDFGRSKSR